MVERRLDGTLGTQQQLMVGRRIVSCGTTFNVTRGRMDLSGRHRAHDLTKSGRGGENMINS